MKLIKQLKETPCYIQIIFFNVLYSEVGKVLCGALRYSARRGLVQMVLYIVVKIAVTFYRRGDVYYLKMWLCLCYQNAHCIVLNESFHLWINLTSSILTKPAHAPTPRFNPPPHHHHIKKEQLLDRNLTTIIFF